MSLLRNRSNTIKNRILKNHLKYIYEYFVLLKCIFVLVSKNINTFFYYYKIWKNKIESKTEIKKKYLLLEPQAIWVGLFHWNKVLRETVKLSFHTRGRNWAEPNNLGYADGCFSRWVSLYLAFRECFPLTRPHESFSWAGGLSFPSVRLLQNTRTSLASYFSCSAWAGSGSNRHTSSS